MAGDWIKMRTDLMRDRAIQRIANDLAESEAFQSWAYLQNDNIVTKMLRECCAFVTVGALHSFWSWAQENTEDGVVRARIQDIDLAIGVPGFAEALKSAGWIEEDGEYLIIPKWDRHNSKGAKSRAESSRRMQERRLRIRYADGVTNTRPNRVREEKRREEVRDKSMSAQEDTQKSAQKRKIPKEEPLEGFDRFWEEYPRKVNKRAAVKAWNKIQPDQDLLQVILVAVGDQRKSPEWRKDGGQFVPHPASWLNGERWNDVDIVAEAHKRAEGRPYYGG